MSVRRTSILLAMLAAAGFPLRAQTPTSPEEKPADRTLVYKEEYIKKHFKDLTLRMLEVAKLLEESEPASARAIQEAVKQAQRSLIEHNMSKVVDYLSRGLVAMAGTTQETVIADLMKVLATLESSAADLDKLNDRIEDWQSFLDKVRQLTRDERRHQQRSRIAAEGEKLGKQMADLGEKLRNIVQRQEELLGNTRKLPSADPLAGELGEARDEVRRLIKAQSGLNDRMADATPGQMMVGGHEQKQLRGRAEKLSKKLGKLGKDPKAVKALARPGGGANAAQAAAGLVGSAAGEMGRSAGKMDATDASGARPHQEQAIHDLKGAEKVLTEAIRNLTGPSRAGKLAKQQSQLGKETSELAGEVRDATAAAGSDSEGGSSLSGQSGQQSPRNNLDRASGHMRDASDRLDRQEKAKAADSQQKALDEMQGEARRLGELARRLLREAEEADLKRQKRDQDVTGEQTRQLAEKMEKSSEGDQKTPGQQSVAGAEVHAAGLREVGPGQSVRRLSESGPGRRAAPPGGQRPPAGHRRGPPGRAGAGPRQD